MYNTRKWLKIKEISAFDNVSLFDLTELLNEFEKFKKEKKRLDRSLEESSDYTNLTN